MRTLQEELKCMREGLHYDAHTPEMYAYRAEVKKKLHQLNVTEYHTSKMPEVTRSLSRIPLRIFLWNHPFIAIMGMVYMQLKEFLLISVLLFWMVLKLLLAGKR